jgi:carboxypeptidase PM20D1
MKKIFKYLALGIFILIAVVLLRALLLSSAQSIEEQPASVEVDEARVVEHMSQALRFKTISFGSEQQDFQPFVQFVAWVKQTYPEVFAALSLEMVADHTMLLKWQGQNPNLKPVLLTAHYDVVPVVPGSEDDWAYPAFDGVVAENYVWGRGALDNKSAVIVMLEALTLLIDQGEVPQRSIYFSFGHDEEIGGTEGAKGVTQLLKSRGVSLAWSLDEGSFILRDLMPGVEKPIASINVAEKGSMSLLLTASGPDGHSSMPAAEVSLDILAQALVALRQAPLPGGVEGITLEMFEGLASEGSFGLKVLAANTWLFGGLIEKKMSASATTNALIRTTTAPTILRAGIKSNVIPPKATATVNFRLHPRDTPESVTAHVTQAINDPRVAIEVIGGGLTSLASTVSEREAPGYRLIAKVARQSFSDLIVVPGLTIAGTDSKHYSKIADNSYRFQFMQVGPEDISGFHGTSERISVENLVKATSAYTLLIRQATAE